MASLLGRRNRRNDNNDLKSIIFESPFQNAVFPEGNLHPRFDCLFLQFPASLAIPRNEFVDSYYRSDGTSPSVKGPEYQRLNRDPGVIVGLNKLSSNRTWTRIEITSRLLGADLNHLLHLGNIDRAFDFLSRFIDFRTSEPLHHSFMTMAHLTVDVPLTAPLSAYVQTLLLTENPRYIRAHHLDESVWFRRDLANLKDASSIGVYNKFLKYSRSRHKDAFLQSLPNLDAVVDYHRSRLRVEHKLLATHFIREAFDIPALGKDSPPPSLLQVLSSYRNPLSSLLEDIVGDARPSLVEDALEAGSLARLEKYKGRLAIIQEAKGDIRALNTLISRYMKGNPSRARREYRELVERLNRDGLGSKGLDSPSLLSEFITSLRHETLGSSSATPVRSTPEVHVVISGRA